MLGLEVIEPIPFQTKLELREDHPLNKKELIMDDLTDLPTVWILLKKDEYLYSENLVDTSAQFPDAASTGYWMVF